MEKKNQSGETLNSLNSQGKISAEDYRYQMIREFLIEWGIKHNIRSLKNEELLSCLRERDIQIESFLQSKGVKGRKCSITKKTFYGFDNNAYPFSGRCSYMANELYVIPARLSGVTPDLIKKFGGNKKFAEYMDKCRGRKQSA